MPSTAKHHKSNTIVLVLVAPSGVKDKEILMLVAVKLNN
jgi:hypothetical protein